MTKKILFVDDDQFMRKVYEDRLVAAGFEITLVESAEAAQRELENGNNIFNIIILDYVLGGMSGPEFLRWLRNEKKSDIPVILMSALSQESVKEESLKAGATLYLAKDKVNPGELVETLQRMLQ